MGETSKKYRPIVHYHDYLRNWHIPLYEYFNENINYVDGNKKPLDKFIYYGNDPLNEKKNINGWFFCMDEKLYVCFDGGEYFYGYSDMVYIIDKSGNVRGGERHSEDYEVAYNEFEQMQKKYFEEEKKAIESENTFLERLKIKYGNKKTFYETQMEEVKEFYSLAEKETKKWWINNAKESVYSYGYSSIEQIKDVYPEYALEFIKEVDLKKVVPYPYQKIAEEILVYKNGFSRGEATKKVLNSSVEEIETIVNIKEDLDVVVNELVEILGLSNDEKMVLDKIILNGFEGVSDETLQNIKDKYRQVTGSYFVYQFLNNIHQKEINLKQEDEIISDEKTNTSVHLELRGWNKAQKSLLFLQQIFTSMDIYFEKESFEKGYLSYMDNLDNSTQRIVNGVFYKETNGYPCWHSQMATDENINENYYLKNIFDNDDLDKFISDLVILRKLSKSTYLNDLFTQYELLQKNKIDNLEQFEKYCNVVGEEKKMTSYSEITIFDRIKDEDYRNKLASVYNNYYALKNIENKIGFGTDEKNEENNRSK